MVSADFGGGGGGCWKPQRLADMRAWLAETRPATDWDKKFPGQVWNAIAAWYPGGIDGFYDGGEQPPDAL